MPGFGNLAIALMGPRQCGRTHGMILGAPKEATLLARDGNHAEFLRRAAMQGNRSDLKVCIGDPDRLRGMTGPFIPDHFTVEGWLMQAEAEIQEQIERWRELFERMTRAEAELKRRKRKKRVKK